MNPYGIIRQKVRLRQDNYPERGKSVHVDPEHIDQLVEQIRGVNQAHILLRVR